MTAANNIRSFRRLFRLSETKWFADHQRHMDELSCFFDTHTHEEELTAQFESLDPDDFTDAEWREIEREYDLLWKNVLCGSCRDVDEEGFIYDKTGEEVVDED